jgi:arginase
MTISLIYAYWPNQPFGLTWCDLPWALRDAGLPKRLADAGHDVLETVAMSEDAAPEEIRSGFELAGQIATDVAKAKAEGELPIILCGSCAIAALAGVSGLGGGPDVGIAWFDAHPDLNTPATTTSGLLEGMALAVATGHAWQALATTSVPFAPASLNRTALFGTRDIDPSEKELIDRHSVPIATNAAGINARFHPAGPTYVHLDMDVHDAITVRTNRFAIAGGPDVATVRSALTSIERVGAIAVTGLDPAAPDGRKAADIAIDHLLAIADAFTRKSD